ncbi:class I lanthipeptide [Taibaiella koreensis]|uniref:class I lanthipeptide n=1 Tax=Taibaiella koreensis TaxID=1268548 RepID=UPI0013C2C9C4|nr:class I lanthipeptide [Taibaiella koreensis]
MKRKTLNLDRKLVLVKEIVDQLDRQKRNAIVGGATAGCGPSAGSPTYDPKIGCITNPCPGRRCS